jgi:D-galactarolactone isomerase
MVEVSDAVGTSDVAAVFPPGTCDTHMHVYDGRFPAAPTALLHPPDAPVARYRAVQRALGIDRVVVVQPTTYGFDNACQVAAAAELGPDSRLIVVVDERTPRSTLVELDAAGARGARFHMLPGGAVPWSSLPPTAAAIADLGWHVQLQLDGRELPDHLATLRSLPTALVVDHVGRFMPPVGADDPAFTALLHLLDTGRCWVKLSAPYESTREGAPTYPTVATLAAVLVERFPERMLWATNWPHPGQPEPPTVDDLRRLASDWLTTGALRQRVLVDNPAELYGFGPPDPRPTGSTT